jgi:hypothetical protein
MPTFTTGGGSKYFPDDGFNLPGTAIKSAALRGGAGRMLLGRLPAGHPEAGAQESAAVEVRESYGAQTFLSVRQ